MLHHQFWLNYFGCDYYHDFAVRLGKNRRNRMLIKYQLKRINQDWKYNKIKGEDV